MFKKKKKKYTSQFPVLISALQPHCLAVLGSHKDSELREWVVSRLLPPWMFLSSLTGYHSSLVEPNVWISTRSWSCRESYSSTQLSNHPAKSILSSTKIFFLKVPKRYKNNLLRLRKVVGAQICLTWCLSTLEIRMNFSIVKLIT